MAIIQSSGRIETCLHKKALFDLTHQFTLDDPVGVARVASGIKCPDCDKTIYVARKGVPIEATTFEIVAYTDEELKKKLASQPAPEPKRPRTRMKTTGLKAGTVAPEFKLPGLDGAEVALADYRGRRVVLVFMHYACGPCDQAAPHLQRLHESGFPVLGIFNAATEESAREESGAMREKAEKNGLTFPILRQTGIAVAKAYENGNVPVAYIVGPDGVLETDLIFGIDGITAKVAELLG